MIKIPKKILVLLTRIFLFLGITLYPSNPPKPIPAAASKMGRQESVQEVKARRARQQAEKINNQLEMRSFDTLKSWFSLPTFAKGNPARKEEHEYVISHFGNKTFNLCVLIALAQEINKAIILDGSPHRIAVPQFWGISSQEISEYLDKTMHLNTLWAQFKKEQNNQTDLDAKAAQTLDAIRKNIAQAFSDPKTIPVSIKKQIEAFLAQHKESLFMVRSTGDEDRTDIANAGGNESVACVESNLEAIWRAMATVVQSYFSEKSLRQRLLAKDNITNRFFIPVLIQRMIGETVWTGQNPPTSQIPVSGVMFTQESAGNTPDVVQIQTAFGHNQGVVNSLVAVDTFYSGPSGIVHPIIRKKIDRLVPMKIGNIFSLERVPNQPSLQSRPTLSAQLAHDLSRIAHEIGKIYNHPMDIEFVIEYTGKKAIIYLVQARPLIEHRFAQSPDYLSDAFIAKIPAQQRIKGETIGMAGGFVRTITNSDELIICNELPQALNEYHDNPDRKNIKAVIVTKMAPATSHEATQFRGYAVPVLVVSPENKQQIELMLSQGGILLDAQRGIVLSHPNGEKESSAATAKGWYTHPIPQHTSIIANYMLTQDSERHTKYQPYIKELSWNKNDSDDLKQTHRELLDIIKRLDTNRPVIVNALKRIIHRISKLAQLKASQSSATQKDKKNDNPHATDYLDIFMHAGGKEEQALLRETHLVLAHTILCAAEILYTFDALATIEIDASEKRIRFLYPIKFLEASILQQDDPEIVACYSYLLLRKMILEDLKAIAALAPSLPKNTEELKQTLGAQTFEYIVQLEKMSALALNDTIEKEWHTFMQQLTKQAALGNAKSRKESSALIQQFATTISQLNDLSVLDLWINTSFITAAEQEKDPLKLCKILIDQVEGTDQKTLKEGAIPNKKLIAFINQKKNILAAWNNKIDTWGDPTQFLSLYKQFNEQFVKEFISGTDTVSQKLFQELMYKGNDIAPLNYKALLEFAHEHAPLIKLLNQASSLGKLIILQFLKQVIDLYDITIKSMTGSPLYKDKIILVHNFSQLLIPYIALMEQITVLLKDQEKMLVAYNFQAYLTKIRQNMQAAMQKPSIELLKNSHSFSLTGVQIGSKSTYQNAEPKTLEDLFTLAHQNMLLCISMLNTEQKLSFSALPIFLKNIGNALNEVRYGNTNAQLLFIQYHYPQIEIYYNLPLYNHSSTFKITYNSKYPSKAKLSVNFFGTAENNRLEVLSILSLLAGYGSKIEFENYPNVNLPKNVNFGTTQFTWVITPDTPLAKVSQYLIMLANAMDQVSVIRDPIHIFKEINNIQKIIPTDIRDSYFTRINSSEVSGDELRTILTEAFSSLSKEVFEKNLFLNEWFVEKYTQAKMYAQALAVIQKTIQKIIHEKNITINSKINPNKSMLTVLLEQLDKLIQLSEDPKHALEVQKQILDEVERFLSRKKNLNMIFEHGNEQEVIEIINIAQMLNKKIATAESLEILKYILNNKYLTELFAFDSDLLNKLIEHIKQSQKNDALEKEFYTQLAERMFKLAQKKIMNINYNWMHDSVPFFIDLGKHNVNFFVYLYQLAIELCDAPNIYNGIDPFHKPKTGMQKRSGKFPGLQYNIAAQIAQELTEVGKSDLAQLILVHLNRVKQKLLKNNNESSDQKVAFQMLEKAQQDIEKLLKK